MAKKKRRTRTAHPGVKILKRERKSSTTYIARWVDPDTKMRIGFEELVRVLNEHAEELMEKYPRLEALRAVGIDLHKRAPQ